MPNSSAHLHSAIWQPMATCEIWLPERYGYLRDIASDAIWLPARYGSLQDISFKQIPISSDLTYPAILPVCEIWLPARYCFRRDLLPGRYGYPRDIASDVIRPPGRYGYPRDIASDVIWPPARYACLQDVSYKRIPISRDLTYLAILTADMIWLFICRRIMVV